MNIVITNDDGYGEPGLEILLKVVEPLGMITVVAPKTPQSFCGHRVSMKTPIRVEQPAPGHYVVHGTPADCARLALKQFLPDADWLISGINPGANLGSDVYQSGTVAAAREAAILGVRAIAISQYIAAGCTLDWEATKQVTDSILPVVMKKPTAIGQYWNINLPSPITPTPAPAHTICPLDKHPHTYRFSEKGDTYHYRGIIHNRQRTEGSDVDVCFSGGISVTPLEI